MGLIILPLALLIAITWFGVILLFAFTTERFIRKILNGGKAALIVYPVFLYLGWWLPNIPGHRNQERMDAVAKQCGWTHTKRIEGVSGTYIDGKGRQNFAPELLDIYGAVEYEDRGRIVHSEQSSAHGYTHQFLERRTFRYGVKRNEKEFVASDIWREELLILDFDSQEILGRRIEYGFSEPRSKSSLGYALGVLLFQPWPCGYTNPGQTDIRTELPKILLPQSLTLK